MDSTNPADAAKQLRDLRAEVAALSRKVATLIREKKSLRAQLVRKKNKDDQMKCPECKTHFARSQQLTKSAKTKARSSISKILRRMYPQDYEK